MSATPISIYFLGSDEFAATVLSRLVEDSRFVVEGVAVPADGARAEDFPVVRVARRYGLELLPSHDDLVGLEMDFLVVTSYGMILPSFILELPRHAALNVHGSMLPRYRGAAPIQAALLNGDEVTAVCVVRMIPRLDAGPVYSFAEVAIRPDHNAQNLREEMSQVGAELLAQTIPGIFEGEIDCLEQNEEDVSFSPKITRESAEVLWAEFSAVQVERRGKAFYPWPGLFTFFKGKRLKLIGCHATMEVPAGVLPVTGTVVRSNGRTAVVCADGIFVLDSVQLEGKRVMSLEDFVRGYSDFEGCVLG